jgi:hypothetical protein
MMMKIWKLKSFTNHKISDRQEQGRGMNGRRNENVSEAKAANGAEMKMLSVCVHRNPFVSCIVSGHCLAIWND